MSAEFNFRDDVHPTCMLQNLFELQKTGTLCDVTIVVNEDEIRAHKVVLASASPYFRAMFTSGLNETMQDRIVMHEMEFSALRDIIYFFYTGEIRVAGESVYLVMEIAHFLQVSAIQAACAQYLLSTLNTSNCLSVHARASLCGYYDVAHKAFRFILQNFRFVMEEEEFLHVPVEILLSVLNSQFINIRHEGQLLEGVVQWWKYDPSERFEHLKPLISKINLEQVPLEDLLSFQTDPLLADTDLESQIKATVNLILEQGDDKHEINTRQGLCHKKSLWKERHSMEQEVILAVGGQSSGIVLGSIECFILGCYSWKCIVPRSVYGGGVCEGLRVIPTMRHARLHAAVTAREYEVFVIGGTNSTDLLDVVEYYSIQSNEWCELARLPLAVEGAGAVFLNRQLYVVGGRSKTNYESRAWVYEERPNAWHDVPSMNKQRGHHCVVAVGGAIYAIGGICDGGGGEDMYLKCMEKYNQARRRWITVTPMHEARASFGCAALDEFIYVMGGYDGTFYLKSVERYNTLTNEWSYMTSMSVARSHFGTTVSDSRIYCLGGYDSIHYLNTVEKFNPVTNRWHCVHGMRMRRFAVGAATLFVPLHKETAYLD